LRSILFKIQEYFKKKNDQFNYENDFVLDEMQMSDTDWLSRVIHNEHKKEGRLIISL
jgi:hypothetical protein